MSIRRHTIYNIFGIAIPLGLSLITIPVYLDMIGEARYGILAISWILLGYFGLFDLGLGRATAQKIASMGQIRTQELSTTFWTALVINAILGVIGGIVIWPVAIYLFGNVIDIDAMLLSELSGTIPWMALAVPLITISGVLTGALQGRSQFLEINIISLTGSVLSQLLPLTIAWLYGPSLSWLLPAVIISRLITIFVLFIRCRKLVFDNFKFIVSYSLAKRLLRFGGWVTVSSVIGPFMVIADKVLIGASLGAKSVTFYTVPFQLAERSTILAGSLSSALFPQLAQANAKERIRLATEASSFLMAITTPLALIGILWVQPFLSWWLGSEFALQTAVTAQFLLVGFWLNGFARIPSAFLQAVGKPQVVAMCHLTELVPYLIFLYIGVQYWGLPGAAVVFGLRTLVDGILLSWFAGTLQNSALDLRVPSIFILGGVLASTLQFDQIVLWSAVKFILPLLSIIWAWASTPLEKRNKFIRAVKSRMNR